MENKDRAMSAFSLHRGLYRFDWMPFELQNASSTVPQTKSAALSAAMEQFALVYHDDITVLFRSAAETSTKPNMH